MRRPVLALAVLAFSFSLLLAQGAAPTGTTLGPSLTPPDASLIAAGPTPGLTFLYTGDAIGYVDPCG